MIVTIIAAPGVRALNFVDRGFQAGYTGRRATTIITDTRRNVNEIV
jgi:hypothetical protein